MDIEQAKLVLENAQKTKTHFVFRELFKDTPTWQDIFEHMSYEYFRDPVLEPMESWSINNGIMSRYDLFYIQIRDAKFHKK